MSRFGSEVAE